MVEWTVDAVKAASKIVHENIRWREGGVGIKDSDLRASLDAGVKAQGLEDDLIDKDIRELMATPVDLFRAKCRAEALEEAAAYMEKTLPHLSLQEYAAAIRALKDKPAQTDGGE